MNKYKFKIAEGMHPITKNPTFYIKDQQNFTWQSARTREEAEEKKKKLEEMDLL